MNRFIYNQLKKWTNLEKRKPLLIRGARQIGKTYTVRQLGKTFSNFVEINFELMPETKQVFEQDLSPQRIIRDLSLILGRKIIAGKTLLFFDEIQAAPNAITALRYFYEEMPKLHVIAAGSLLDFALEEVGVPVGRVNFLHMYPMSFIEFLYAVKYDLLAQEILHHQPDTPLAEPIHSKALELLSFYMAVGGMPEAVQCWLDTQDLTACNTIHHQLINTYRQDFQKYAKKFQLKYVELLFDRIPLSLAQPFKYSNISKDYKKRELEPCLILLLKAGIIHQVFHSSGNGIPIGAESNLDKFKIIFVDIALSQAILGLDTKGWILNPKQNFINKGAITESFVGQELLAYSAAYMQQKLYYWQRESRSSNAEIDYLIQQDSHVIPVEIKSGEGRSLKSMKLFLQQKPNSPYGIRFSIHNYSKFDAIHSYPLYAVANCGVKSRP
jgi:predicted AAA+ superfamily ATPase